MTDSVEETGRVDDTELVEQRVQLVELVDRVLDRGVLLRGEVTIGVAGVDLVHLELQLLLSSVQTLLDRPQGPPTPGERGRPPQTERRPPPTEGPPRPGKRTGPPPPGERRPPPSGSGE